MPTFYFDIHDGSDFRDTDGVHLADVKAAEAQALRSLIEMVQWLGSDWSDVEVIVRDENDQTILRVSANITVQRVGKPQSVTHEVSKRHSSDGAGL